MAKVIVYTHPYLGESGNRVSVIAPDPEDRRFGESEWGWLDRVGTRSIRAYYPGDKSDPAFAWLQAGIWAAEQPRAVIDSSQLPSKRFRNCWRAPDGGAVRVVVALARLQILAEVRRERNLRLLLSDGEFTRLLEIGTDQQRADLRVYRQALRDLPATVQAEVDGLSTPAQLEAYVPVYPTQPPISPS